MTQFLQLTAFGVVTAAFLLISVLGFSLVRRVEGFLNIAHAELISVSAFVTWYLSSRQGWHFLAAAVAATVITAVLGLGIARVFYEPLRGRGPAVLLITSVGVVFLMHGVTEGLVGTGIRSYDIPLAGLIEAGQIRVTTYQMWIVVTAVVTTAGLALFLDRTRIGTTIRAMAVNAPLAAARGLDVTAASRATWLVASGLAGVAGVTLGVLGTLTTDLAFGQILVILAVAILAGLGSLYGVIVASLVIGLTMDLSVLVLPPGYRPMVAFLVVILVLLIRPHGLAGRAA